MTSRFNTAASQHPQALKLDELTLRIARLDEIIRNIEKLNASLSALISQISKADKKISALQNRYLDGTRKEVNAAKIKENFGHKQTKVLRVRPKVETTLEGAIDAIMDVHMQVGTPVIWIEDWEDSKEAECFRREAEFVSRSASDHSDSSVDTFKTACSYSSDQQNEGDGARGGAKRYDGEWWL